MWGLIILLHLGRLLSYLALSIGDGTFEPRIHAALPLSEAAEAMRIIEDREQFGKVIVNP